MRSLILAGSVLLAACGEQTTQHGDDDVFRRVAHAQAMRRLSERSALVVTPVRTRGPAYALSIKLKISNQNEFDVHDPVVTCSSQGPSGSIIESNERTVYQTVRSHSSITTRYIAFGAFDDQSKSISCETARWQRR